MNGDLAGTRDSPLSHNTLREILPALPAPLAQAYVSTGWVYIS